VDAEGWGEGGAADWAEVVEEVRLVVGSVAAGLEGEVVSEGEAGLVVVEGGCSCEFGIYS